MTHHPNQQTPEADRCRSVDRSLLEFLKPKAEERYSKLEAYCDLLSKASSVAGNRWSPPTVARPVCCHHFRTCPSVAMAACHGSPVYLRTHQTWSAFRRAILQELYLLCQPGATSLSSYRKSGRHPRLLRHAVHPLHQRQSHRQGSGRFLQPLLRLEDEHGQAGRIWGHSCQACTQPAGPGV